MSSRQASGSAPLPFQLNQKIAAVSCFIAHGNALPLKTPATQITQYRAVIYERDT